MNGNAYEDSLNFVIEVLSSDEVAASGIDVQDIYAAICAVNKVKNHLRDTDHD